ncbi:InlB B-repeat-containing protein [Faecalibacterium sp. Marseille-Q0746]|uniref:InlB B-repeat-containing protein n=1 Tax=Faecalibacterium sp. Marseille-Q0746 TaxID=2817019 RepID=UPI001A9B16B5|nr:InlB B-repeat-containing protein [Faecalibacterium sp. Marseille-Q0746]MBO1345034.1 InlB B-repeat-containing protein [Faecalibacterium sp. Marseille-Q0746]
MKQKSQNRFLAALLAVAMMLQMLPMLAFADDAAGTPVAWNENKNNKGYPSLEAAVIDADSGDTIILGAGNYTLHNKLKDNQKPKGKDLTFVGQGSDKTTWYIGAKVPDPNLLGTEYNGDYSFDGAGTVTFKNMTLRSGDKDYLGFIRIDNTVVENCVINGKTDYWGYTSAKFIDTTFNAPNGQYALWTYCSPIMTFDNCTFNASGKVINVYTDYSAEKFDITVNFNNCTVNSNFQSYVSMFSNNKTALNINDSNMGSHKYIININDPKTITAARDKTTTCSQMFGFGGKAATNNKGKTDVYLNGELVWTNGKMQTHSYTDGEHDQAFTTTYSEWKTIDARNEWRDVTKTCNYCGRLLEEHKEIASVYRLQYNLNEGVGAENVDYSDANYRQNESVTLKAAPTREGYQFAGWLSLKGKLYKAESELEQLTGDEVFTAQWKKDEPVVNHTLTVTGGTFAVKNGDIDVTDTLETSTDEASGKQTCLVPDGAEVTVTLDQTKVPDGMVFDLWSTGKFDLPLGQDYKAESITFTMTGDVDVAAQYRSADIEDGSDVVGPIIVGTAVVAGGALVGYTLGTDLVGKMWGLPYFPSNRSALAMMLWEDAGKPMPESEILYPDVGQEEQDMDLQHAARWSMEHDLLPDLNDQDTELPPEQVKFYPDNMVTKISVLRAWKKAQDLKQNAQ